MMYTKQQENENSQLILQKMVLLLFTSISSVAQSCPTLCSPMNCSTLGFPIVHYLSLLKLMFIELVMPSNHLILCCPLLLLPSIFLSLRVFTNESELRIRWPKILGFQFQYQSFL